jgi:hypothetical protein
VSPHHDGLMNHEQQANKETTMSGRFTKLKRMIWHDKRLLGNAPPIADNTHVVDATTDLDGSIGWIAHYAETQGGLDELIIMCHGMEGNFDLSKQASTMKAVGGLGLQICKQGLNIGNVNKVEKWLPDRKDPTTALIQRVIIYSCAAAETGPGNVGTWGDGMRFMGYFAMNSGAFVVAGRDAQGYTGANDKQLIDFGDWEGPVYLFSPVDGKASPYQPGAMR